MKVALMDFEIPFLKAPTRLVGKAKLVAARLVTERIVEPSLRDFPENYEICTSRANKWKTGAPLVREYTGKKAWRMSAMPMMKLILISLICAATAFAGDGRVASLIQSGRQELLREEYDKAVLSFQRVVRLDSGSAEGYAGLGKSYLKLGANEYMSNPMELEKGVKALETALRLDPAFAEARRDLGLTWLALGDRKMASRELELLEKTNPNLAAELAAAIAAFQPPPVYPAFRDSGQSEDNVTRVDIQRNAVLVPVTLTLGTNRIDVRLLLDTGASVTVINPATASKLGISLNQAPQGSLQVVGGGSIVARAVRLDHVTVGPHTRSGMVVAVIEHRGKKVDSDGLLGMDFLRDVRYHVDFKTKTINWTR